MANKEIFKKGLLEFLTLYVLSQKDMYPYQIAQEIKSLTNSSVTVTDGLIYPIIYRFQKEGYLSEWTQEVKRRIRVYYHLEPSGCHYLTQCINEYRLLCDILNPLLEKMETEHES